MVWNKTPEHIVQAIAAELRSTYVPHVEIAGHYGVSDWLVGEINRSVLSPEERRHRKVTQDSNSKLKKNHMRGRTGMKNHNATTKIVRKVGYITRFKPDWWTGKTIGGRVYEHRCVYCENNGITEVPKGYVIHHIDENIDNNTIDNLLMLTISDHMKLHSELRKVQRLSREGVGDSVSEAHTALTGL
jgi:HNH endonuclease